MTEEKLVTDEELKGIFDTGFLEGVRKTAKKVKELKLKDDEVAFYNIHLAFQFENLDDPLTYSDIENKMNMKMHPVLKSDLEKEEQDVGDQASV